MLVTPATARLLLEALAAGGKLAAGPPGDDADALDAIRRDLAHVAATPEGPLEDAEVGNVPGAGDGRGPGVTPFDPGYRAVIVDSIGAVGMILAPGKQRALYLEVAGRLNKRQERDEGAMLLAPGQAAELVADVVVAVQAIGDRGFAQEFEEALAREQARRGLERPA